MDTRRDEIAALNDEYDAKMDALSADSAALETKRQEILLVSDKMDQQVRELEAKTRIEEVNQEMVALDITKQQLQSARADLELLQTQLRRG